MSSPEHRASSAASSCGAWIMHEGPCVLPKGHEGPHSDLLEAVVERSWDYDDAYGGPWRIGHESREEGRLAIKSGPFTIVTVGDYFDGGGPVEDRVQFICDVLNEKFSREGLEGV